MLSAQLPLYNFALGVHYYMERMVLLKDLKFWLDTDQQNNFVELSK